MPNLALLYLLRLAERNTAGIFLPLTSGLLLLINQ